jgi:TPR repeat protein/TolA-binding protein
MFQSQGHKSTIPLNKVNGKLITTAEIIQSHFAHHHGNLNFLLLYRNICIVQIMQSKRPIKKIFRACLFWAVVFNLCSCVPATLTKTDVHNLQLSAEKGDAKSQVLIGELHEYGVSVPADQTVAAKWYQQAANQGNPEAQYYLGVMYERGVGVSQNTAESLKWLFKSGEQGQEKAQIWLALVYLKDKGHQKEFLRRIRGYRQNAEKGNTSAQYSLGWIYREGAGLPVNPQEALKWYRKAAIQENAKAQFALGNIYLEGRVAPVNPKEALVWYQKSAGTEIKAQVKLCKLYEGEGGIQKNEEEAQKWSRTLAKNTDASIRSYINTQRAILGSEKEKNPARALRACDRIFEIDPADRKVSNTCEVLHQQISEKMNSRIQEALNALEKKDWDMFRDLLPQLLTPDFDELQLRRLIASAWRLIEEETRSTEKIAQELLRSIEAAERSKSYRMKNIHQIPKLISAFKTTVNNGLRDNPGDEALMALAQRGKKVIASLQEKIKPSRPMKNKREEKAITDSQEEIPEDNEPGEDDYKNAQALFDNGRFGEAAQLFEKMTKIRGFKYIASAYIYLGVTHLARINPANINEARKLRLKGLACFQNALRFDNKIVLPAGYDKYQPVFEEAKKKLR